MYPKKQIDSVMVTQVIFCIIYIYIYYTAYTHECIIYNIYIYYCIYFLSSFRLFSLLPVTSTSGREMMDDKVVFVPLHLKNPLSFPEERRWYTRINTSDDDHNSLFDRDDKAEIYGKNMHPIAGNKLYDGSYTSRTDNMYELCKHQTPVLENNFIDYKQFLHGINTELWHLISNKSKILFLRIVFIL